VRGLLGSNPLLGERRPIDCLPAGREQEVIRRHPRRAHGLLRLGAPLGQGRCDGRPRAPVVVRGRVPVPGTRTLAGGDAKSASDLDPGAAIARTDALASHVRYGAARRQCERLRRPRPRARHADIGSKRREPPCEVDFWRNRQIDFPRAACRSAAAPAGANVCAGDVPVPGTRTMAQKDRVMIPNSRLQSGHRQSALSTAVKSAAGRAPSKRKWAVGETRRKLRRRTLLLRLQE
jgi:hypothetical protein